MAYCRLSDTCDVYMFNSVLGYWDISTAVSVKDPNFKFPDNIKSPRERMNYGIQFGMYIPWDHPFANKIFKAYSREEAMSILLMLRREGVRIPDYAIERLQKEIDNESN